MVSLIPERYRWQEACLVGVLVFSILAPAQQLKTINPPGGGTIVYGQVAGQTTEAGAMGAILRSVHQNVGEKPQVGKLFQVHGTESVAAFFSATRRNGSGGQVAGLIIVTKVSTDHVEAGMVTDQAARFNRTLQANMKTLFAAWHPLKDAATSASDRSSGPTATLRTQSLPDRSASIGLPDNWKIVPNLSGGGTIVAVGPNGENAFLDLAFNAADTNSPTVQRTMQALRAGQLQGTMYAKMAYIPYGADMQKSLVYLWNKSRTGGGMQPADFRFNSFSAPQPTGSSHCARFAGTVDFKDQKGAREMNGAYCVGQLGRMGMWGSQAYMTTAPMDVAARERATLGAIMASFNVNQQVIAAEAGQIAAPAIAQIHAIGQAAANQARAAHQAEDIQRSSVYQHWDSMDRRSQEFENYQLGYSVISDNQNSAHGTFWNEDADALVKSDPNRFEYVNAPNYWKGIDY
jgi:hypothetical protein